MDRDFHIHTFFSPCADPAMSFAVIADTARAAGLKDIGLIDHPYRPDLQRHHAALNQARAQHDGAPRIWIGAELEVVGMGKLIMSPADLPHADYILAAPSHYDLIHYPPVPHLDSPIEWADRLLTDMENVPGSGAHAMAHPFFVYALHVAAPEGMVLPRLEDVLAEIRPKRVEWLLERLAEAEIAIEISPRLSLNPAFAPFAQWFYKEAKQCGIRFLFGSDSHRPNTIGTLGKARAFAEGLDLGPEHLWYPE